jgi:hypothetical protein
MPTLWIPYLIILERVTQKGNTKNGMDDYRYPEGPPVITVIPVEAFIFFMLHPVVAYS